MLDFDFADREQAVPPAAVAQSIDSGHLSV